MNNKAFLYLFIFTSFVFTGQAQNSNSNSEIIPTEVEGRGLKIKEDNFKSFSTSMNSEFIEVWKQMNEPKYYGHPEFAKTVKIVGKEVVEVLSKRTEYSKYFVDVNDTSSFYVQQSFTPLSHYENDYWKTIEKSLVELSPTLYQSKFYLEPPGFELDKESSFIKTVKGKVNFNDWKLYKQILGQEVFLASANWSNVTAGDDGIYITNVFEGIDASMQIRKGAIKTNFILKKNAFGVFDELIFKDEFSGEGNINLYFPENPSANDFVGKVDVQYNGESALNINEGIGYPVGGEREDIIHLRYKIATNNIGVVVPYHWIESNIDNRNLIIDPLVTGTNTTSLSSITGSMYNASCDFINSCDYSMNVNFPANSTMTDVIADFSYFASGDCWLMDGAMEFSSGNCVSPSQASYFWFCNSTLGGTCTGEDIPIASDVQNCMPQPACSEQEIPFTLRFYRSCYGASGCSSDCVGPYTDWKITIYAKTLESTVNIPTTTICEGESQSASALGTFGVPPYTYSWTSTGSTETETGENVSFSFEEAGNHTISVNVTDNCGNTISDSESFTVNPPPMVDVVASPNTICVGESSTLTASGASTYTWSGGGLSGSGETQTVAPTENTTYTVVGTENGCASEPVSITVSIGSEEVPSFDQISNICEGEIFTLPPFSIEGIPGTWSPEPNNTETTTYTFTPNPGECATTTTMTIDVDESTTPSFDPIDPICEGETFTLPPSSINGIFGTWSPDIDNTITTTYTFTPDDGQCASTVTLVVEVTSSITPGFEAIDDICSGEILTLPTMSENGIEGTWSPAVDNTATTTYTFTPTSSECALTQTITVVVNPSTTPDFIPVDAICEGETFTLPEISTNNIEGTWSPAIDNSTTTTYTFTPDSDQCSSTQTMTVTVNPLITPSFNTISTLCEGETFTLPTTSINGVSGTWSPALNNIATTTYTFTPEPNQCALSETMTVTVSPVPTFTVSGVNPTTCTSEDGSITFSGLEPNSTYSVGYNGTTSTGTTDGNGNIILDGLSQGVFQNFEVGVDDCIGTNDSVITLEIPDSPTVNAGQNQELCEGEQVVLSASDYGNATISWDNGVTDGQPFSPTVTMNYTVTATNNGCSSTDIVTVTVNPIPSVSAGNDQSVCFGNEVTLSGSGADFYFWDNGVVDGVPFAPQSQGTTTYTVVGTTEAGCENSDQVTVTVVEAASVSFTSDIIVGCPPLKANFTSSVTSGSCTYTLSDGTVISGCNPSYIFLSEGCHDVVLTVLSEEGCVSTYTQNNLICVLPSPNADFAATPMVINGFQNEVTFMNTTTGATQYMWNFDDGSVSNESNPTHIFDVSEDEYIVTLVASNTECTDTVSMLIKVEKELIYYVPNAFTPDNDDYNEIFKPIFTTGFDPYNYHLTILNRWGEIVFESYNAEYGWDGTFGEKIAEDGVYIWKIEFKVKATDERKVMLGQFSLIR